MMRHCPDTSKDGKAAAVIDPGTHDWEVIKGHPDYISPEGESVLVDGANLADARADPHPLCKEDL